MLDRRLHEQKLRLSQDLPEARRERVLPAPIRMHHASNKVRRKLQEAHQAGEEGLKGRRIESCCAGTFTPLHFQSHFIRVIIHQQSSRVLILPSFYYFLFFKRLQSPHPLFRKSSALKRYGAEAILSPSAEQLFLQDAHCTSEVLLSLGVPPKEFF